MIFGTVATFGSEDSGLAVLFLSLLRMKLPRF